MDWRAARDPAWRAGRARPRDIPSTRVRSRRGDLFFAIRGERFDAHDFVADALSKGACAAVVASAKARDLLPEGHAHPLLLVEDPLVALQTLAAAVRRHWGKRVVAVTARQERRRRKKRLRLCWRRSSAC